MWLWSCLFSFALAQSPSAAEDLQHQWRSLQLLRADAKRYRVVTEPFTVQDGPVSLTIDSGLLVPIFSGHTPNDRSATGQIRIEAWAENGVVTDGESRGNVDFVGFVWVAGKGSTTVEWTERSDHRIFANHMVHNLRHPKADFQDVADGAPWTVGATEAVVLSVDADVEELFLGPDDLSNDPLEVVVYGEKPRPGALQRAKTILEHRGQDLRRAGIDVKEWIATDRVLTARGRRDTGAHAMIDVHVDERLGNLAVARDDQPMQGTGWLTLLRDDTGVTDPRLQTGVWVLDMPPAGYTAWVLTGVPFPPSDPEDPLSAPQAPVRIEAEDAYVIVGAHDGGAAALVEVVARLKLRARGGVIDSFDLHIPRGASERDFEVVSVDRDDGVSLLSDTPLVDHDAVLSPWRKDSAIERDPDKDIDGDGVSDGINDGGIDGSDGSGDDLDPSRRRRKGTELQDDPYLDRPESRVTLIPPEPLQPDEAIIIDVRWTDKWAISGVQSFELSTGGSMLVDRGAGSGRRSVLPRVAGSPNGNPSKFRIRMVATDRHYLRSASSGTLTHTSKDPYFVTTESGQVGHNVPFVEVALGDFRTFDEATPGFPTVRTRMLSRVDGQPMAAEIRRLIRFYEGYMPKYAWEEHEIMQSPARFNAWVWVASHEMTSAMQAKATNMTAGARLARQDGKFTGQRVLAHELAHQWWGHLVQPAHTEDFWFCETFAESMAQIYTGAIRGSYVRNMQDKREDWEQFEDLNIPRASLTDAYRSPHQAAIVYRYGPTVMQELLRPRIGHERYHGALDLLLRDHAHEQVTTERILDYFEKASGQQLDDFFEFWVYGGFLPERVELTWQHREGQVVGVIISDVPFGTFDVDVALDDEIVTVDVIDGVGRFAIDRAFAPRDVVLDPELTILATKRTVREGNPDEVTWE